MFLPILTCDLNLRRLKLLNSNIKMNYVFLFLFFCLLEETINVYIKYYTDIITIYKSKIKGMCLHFTVIDLGGFKCSC